MQNRAKEKDKRAENYTKAAAETDKKTATIIAVFCNDMVAAQGYRIGLTEDSMNKKACNETENHLVGSGEKETEAERMQRVLADIKAADLSETHILKQWTKGVSLQKVSRSGDALCQLGSYEWDGSRRECGRTVSDSAIQPALPFYVFR
ncbi:MAG: hypothetical protein GX245_00515 [Eubacteriaceae bacterium]|nr:hypothetical protein [Eubacteriaceae bacterium]